MYNFTIKSRGRLRDFCVYAYAAAPARSMGMARMPKGCYVRPWQPRALLAKRAQPCALYADAGKSFEKGAK